MKPIIFSTPMVQAILDGRKTQTRRIVKPQPSSGIRKSVFVKSGLEDGHGREIKPRYQPSDILWVRETWAEVSSGIIEYKATYKEPYTGSAEIDHIGNKIKWRPSIHMPRETARIFLLLTNVRVERVQDITDADILAEGFECREDFIVLWNILNEKRGHGWNKNDWVYAYTFEKISREEAERLEWKGYDIIVEACCPICHNREEEGHEEGCELAALLKESEVEKNGLGFLRSKTYQKNKKIAQVHILRAHNPSRVAKHI